MTDFEPTTVTDRPLRKPSIRGSIVGVVLAAVALGLGLFASALGVLTGLWVLHLFALVIPIVVLGFTALALVGISAVTTGRRNITGAIVATICAAALFVALTFNFGTPWLPSGMSDGPFFAFVISAVAGALTFGLFLGPRPIRIVGAIAAVALFATIAVLPIFEEREVQAELAEADADYALKLQAEERRLLAEFEMFIVDGVHPMVVDLPGAQVSDFAVGSSAQSFVTTSDGGVAEVRASVWDSSSQPVNRCFQIALPTSGYSATTLDEAADWCTVSGDTATLADGSAASEVRDNRLIAVTPSFDTWLVGPDHGTHSATPAEIQEILAALRPMTEAELRAELTPQG